MGTSLTGTKPKDTYDSLIKVTDNGPLSGTMKTLTDGLGNDSVLALSTTAAGIGTTVLTDISSSGAGNEGAYIKNDGQIGLATSNDAVGIFNRKTSTGTLFDFRYNGTPVGSIGVTATGASINLGGTAGANALDDYEEGTFTPTMLGADFTLTTANGYYTKIGRQVSIWIECEGTYSSPTGVFRVSSLPFSQAGGRAEGLFSAIIGISFADYCTAETIGTTMYLESHVSGTGVNRIDMNSTYFNASGFRFMISQTYFV